MVASKPTPPLSSNCGGDVVELQGTCGLGLGGTEGVVEGTVMGMATKVKGDGVELSALVSKPPPQTHDGGDEMVVAPTTSTASITEVPGVGHHFVQDGRKQAASDEVEHRVDRPPPPPSRKAPTASSAREDTPRRTDFTPASPSTEAQRASEERRRAFALRRRESPVHSGLWRAHEAGITTGGTVLSESFLRRRHAVGVGVGVVSNTAGRRGRVMPPEPAAAVPSTSPPRVVASPPAQVVVGESARKGRVGVNNILGGSGIYNYSTDLTSSLHSAGSLSGSSGRFYHVVAIRKARPVRSDSHSGGGKSIRGTSFGSSVVSSLTNSVGLFGSSSSFLSSSLSSFNKNSASISNHSSSVPSAGGGSSSATTVHSLCSSLSTFDSARVRDPFKDSLRPRGGGAAAAAVARRRHRPRLVPGPRRPPLRALADSTSSDLGFDVDADARVDVFKIDDDGDCVRDLSAESSSRRVPPPSSASSSYSTSESASTTSGNHTLLHGWLPPPLVPRSASGSGTDTTAKLGADMDMETETETAVSGSESGSGSVAPPPHPPRPSWMPSPLAAAVGAADTPLRYYPSNLSTGGAHRLRQISAVATRMRIRMASATSWYSGEGVEAAAVVGEDERVTSANDGEELESSKEEGGEAVDGYLGPSAAAGPTVIVTPTPESDDDVARARDQAQTGAGEGVADLKPVDGGEGVVEEDAVVDDDDDDEAIFVVALPRSISWSADHSSSSSSSSSSSEVIEARDVVADGPSLAWAAAASMKRCLSHDDVDVLFLDSSTTLTHGSEDRSPPPSPTSSSASGSTDTDDAEECFRSSIIAAATDEGRNDSGSAGGGGGRGGTEPEVGAHLRPIPVHDPWGAEGQQGHASSADERERAILEYYYGRSPSSLSSVLSFQILGTSASDPSTHPHVLSPPLMESLQSFLPPSVVAEGEPSNFWLRYSLVRDGSSLHTLLHNIRGARHTILAVETVGGEVIGSFTSSPWRRMGARFYGTGEAFLWRLRRPRTDTGDTGTSSTGDAGGNKSVIDQARLESELDVYPWTGRNGYVQLCTGDRIALGGGRLLTTTVHGAEEEESSTFVDHQDASKVGDGVDFGDECGGEGGGFGLVLDGNLLYGASSPCATFGNPSLTGCGKAGGGQFEILNVEVWSLTPFASIEEAKRTEAAAIFVEENRV